MALSFVADRLTTSAGAAVDTLASAAFTPGVGNLLVVTVSFRQTTGTPSLVVSDSVNGTYTQAFLKAAQADALQTIAQCYKTAVAGGSTVVTVNPGTAAAVVQFAVSEFAGQDVSATVFDQAVTTGAQVNSATPSLTTAGLGNAHCAAVAGLIWTNTTSNTMAPGSGWTQVDVLTGSAGRSMHMERQITTTAAAVVAAWSSSVAIDANMAVGVYREAPPPKAPPPPRRPWRFARRAA